MNGIKWCRLVLIKDTADGRLLSARPEENHRNNQQIVTTVPDDQLCVCLLVCVFLFMFFQDNICFSRVCVSRHSLLAGGREMDLKKKRKQKNK